MWAGERTLRKKSIIIYIYKNYKNFYLKDILVLKTKIFI